jgi:hypothetical protein
MSYHSQSSPRRGAGRQFSKSAHEKKSKEKKQRQGSRYLSEEKPELSADEAAQKTQGSLSRLGTQVFALSPFSQYFDDWLLNLREVIEEFETNPAVKVDEQFTKESAQTFQDVQAALAEHKIQEINMTTKEKELADNNHRIFEADREYAEKSSELRNSRNAEIRRLTSKTSELEDEVARQREIRVSVFRFVEKRRVADELEKTVQSLNEAKKQLEVAMQNFGVEQEKLHDAYEKRKQDLFETSDRLHKEIENLETDPSTATRKQACEALSNAVNSLLQRMPH